MRFFPDISFQSAEAVVDEALKNEKSLLRVLSSKREAEDYFKMFKKADPPIRVEVYDIKLDDVILF